MRRLTRLFPFFVMTLLASSALGQHLRTPLASPHARADETFGITAVSVDYHRPSVNNRRIWGGLVPYDVLWRAGANENTTVSFSTPVKVEGQPLPAGTYSFFLIPGQQQWTAIFNKFTGGWGTYSYDAAEDALHVPTAAPQQAEMQERLLYTFDENKEDSVTLNMRWEKLRVPLHITADTKSLVSAMMKDQLRSSLHWDPQAWTEAARYAFQHGDTDSALEYVDHAVIYWPDAQSLRLKARILEKRGDAKGSQELLARSAQIAPADVIARSKAYGLIGAKKYDEATAVISEMIASDSKAFRAYVLQGDLYAARGDEAKAQESYAKAMSLAPGQSERVEVQDSINAMMAEKEKK